ncbi:uncharacterized protein LOC112342410 [Selaginella moellendorffii]|uniref:uncharacterized protein LOC112342410 n=1 Tax=Selaginella moellendorffii TaxID=88036 RepID=UPI000D1CA75D|nr:uncharacterized protein LOC112342410 [Selaginella moellendorffii]|eukprot:XP_024519950.1 uncharacterized protein LOC112342410 [Selaginella moellendorffii]
MDDDSCATPIPQDHLHDAMEGAEVALRSTRASRWLKDETITLVQAKRVYEQEVAEAASRGQIVNKEQKWKRISKKCEDAGVVRDASQCRKRWQNIVRDYKRVKDWQNRNSRQSYWLMSVEEKRENKLIVPPVFDKDIFEELDHFLANRPGVPPTVYDSERIVHQQHHHFKRQPQVDDGAHDHAAAAFLQAGDLCPPLLQIPNAPSSNDEQGISSSGKRKRPKPAPAEDSMDRLEAILEKNTKIVIQMQERMCEKHESHLEAMVHAIQEMTSSLNKMIDKL